MQSDSIMKLRKYIDKKIKEDSEFAKDYQRVVDTGINIDKKLDSYVTSQARVFLKNQSGFVTDSQVFNWVFDFFHDYDANSPKQQVKQVVEDDEEDEEECVECKPVVAKPQPQPKKQESKNYEEVSLFEL